MNTIIIIHRVRKKPAVFYRVGQKTRPLYIFLNIWQTTNDNYTRFLHTSKPVYNVHVYNMRVYLFYHLKWRHLVNRLPLINATLKLHHHDVGRHLAHRQDECFVCGTGGQGRHSILVIRRLTVTASVQDATITSGRCIKTARRLTPPEAICN